MYLKTQLIRSPRLTHFTYFLEDAAQWRPVLRIQAQARSPAQQGSHPEKVPPQAAPESSAQTSTKQAIQPKNEINFSVQAGNLSV
jgi:hypothetical protein